MVVLEAHELEKRYTSEPVLQGLSFKVMQGEKVGLVGENGCGKSTLLKLVAGLEAPTGGVLTRPGSSTVGYLAQELQYTQSNTVHQELLEVFAPLRALGERLEGLQKKLAAPGLDIVQQQELLDQYGHLADQFEREGGYTYAHRIDTVLTGLGLVPRRDQQVEGLSGGEKNVLALARLLLQEPEILLLDEPANHLDLEGLEWLETFLGAYPRTLLLVSHNRHLLDQVVTRVLEIGDTRLALYRGNYTAYRAQKQQRLLEQQAAYQDQQKEIRRLEEMIARFERWGSMTDDPRPARRARNKQRQIDRMEKVERPQLERERIDPRFSASHKGGRIALEIKGYSRELGGRPLFAGAELLISYGERVGLFGPNGCGKTTLCRDIVAQGAWDHPVLRLGPQVKLGYYAQQHETLNPALTVMEQMLEQRGLTRDRAFQLLLRFLFGWQDLDQKVATLSGGQKSRLQLARLMAAQVNFLLLDEPTNHLDIFSCEKVEEALEAFEGTVLVISHDRYFLDRIVGRIAEVRDLKLMDHPGTFAEYWERRKSADAPAPAPKAPVPRLRPPRPAKTAPPQTTAQELIAARLETLEREKEEVEKEMAAAYEAGDHHLGGERGRRLGHLEAQIAAQYAAWEEVLS
ncbi:MAG: ABC-F family ATP-binding cassette domain-containing protein [Candidatus Handelsmanbacteria bacterium]|nr:ABC-F family ATP-binding cassette domain-containing protein [Candidatus Handelsmanbacteria bacterium]